jgi:hypothetical protein
MSKRVPQIGEADGEVVGLAAQFRVHDISERKRYANRSLCIFYRP